MLRNLFAEIIIELLILISEIMIIESQANEGFTFIQKPLNILVHSEILANVVLQNIHN